MFNSLHTSDSPLSHINLLDLAKNVKLISRQTRGFSAWSILISFLKCVSKGDASFNRLALEMALLNDKGIAKSSLHKRVAKPLSDFFRRIVEELLLSQNKSINKAARTRFQRIIIEDSTFVPMGALNAGNFPACGNQSGTTAGFKLDLALDILGQSILELQLGSGRQSDKTFGNAIIEKLQAGDLLLRDMGYYSQQTFRDITHTGAHWISRVPANVELRGANAKPLNIKLRSRKNNRIDELVEVGREGFKVRLVGIRLDNATAARKRRQRRANHARRGTQPSQQALTRDGWCLMITSLDSAVSAEEVLGLYKARWHIETRFKAWKQSLNQKQTLKRYTSYNHLECIVLVALIHQLLAHHLFRTTDEQTDRLLSIEKISEAIASHICTLTKQTRAIPITIHLRLITMDRRKRKSLMENLLNLK